MDFDFGGNSLQDIAALVGALIALGLALQAGVGPTVMFLTEAVKDAFKVRPGFGGLLAVFIGSLLGMGLGLLTAVLTQSTYSEYIGLILIGLFAGLFMGSGAVQSHKSAALVNTEAASAIQQAKGVSETDFVNGYAAGHDEGIRTANFAATNGFSTLADVDEPWRGPGLATAESEAEDADDIDDDLAPIIAEGPGEVTDDDAKFHHSPAISLHSSAA
jgi:hypothetical protein